MKYDKLNAIELFIIHIISIIFEINKYKLCYLSYKSYSLIESDVIIK